MKVPRALDKGCSWPCKEREDVKKNKLCQYTWNELGHKRIVHKVQGNGRFTNADRCLVLSVESVKDSLNNTPFEAGNRSEKLRILSGVRGGSAVLGIISLFRSSDIMIVYFDNKQKVCDKDGIYYGTVDYEFFMGKMVEWGIRLDTEI